MIRQMIKIDQEKCNGCGLCADACHESAIEIQNGKAIVVRDDFCDGLGDCLPVCPTGAITFEMREAAAYDKEAVDKRLQAKAAAGNVEVSITFILCASASSTIDIIFPKVYSSL